MEELKRNRAGERERERERERGGEGERERGREAERVRERATRDRETWREIERGGGIYNELIDIHIIYPCVSVREMERVQNRLQTKEKNR